MVTDKLIDLLNKIAKEQGYEITFLKESDGPLLGIEEVLKTVCNYTTDDQFDELLKHIEEKEHYGGIPYPEFELTERNQLLWEILVIVFGDYGVSPRRGWLKVKYKDRIINCLKDDEEEEK